MLLNQDKCKCLHIIGRINGKSDYKIQNAILNTTAEENKTNTVWNYVT